jgi:hypothetical protein
MVRTTYAKLASAGRVCSTVRVTAPGHQELIQHAHGDVGEHALALLGHLDRPNQVLQRDARAVQRRVVRAALRQPLEVLDHLSKSLLSVGHDLQLRGLARDLRRELGLPVLEVAQPARERRGRAGAVNESTTLPICAFTRSSSSAIACLSGCFCCRTFARICAASSRSTPRCTSS